jgi:type IV pilus biogenesis protein CpaD/CtpE
MKNIAEVPKPYRRALPRVAVVLVAVLPLLASCAAERRDRTSTVNVREVTTTPLPPMTDISIINLHDEPTSDASSEKVVGTIVNNGDKAVSQLTIRVDAIDGSGRVVNSVTTPPLAQTIGANGGQGQFSATMPRDPAVTTYKAVAIAR